MPTDPILKIDRFRQRFNVAENGQFLQLGSMGKIFIYCRIQLEFRLKVRLKLCNDQGEFELDWAKSKDNIAENSVALGYETHNRTVLFIPIEAFCIMFDLH